MTPNAEHAVSKIALARSLVVVTGVGEGGIPMDDDFIGRVGHDKTITDRIRDGHTQVAGGGNSMAVNRHITGRCNTEITGQVETIFQKANTCECGIGRQGRRQAHTGPTEGRVERLPSATHCIDKIIADGDRAGCAGHGAIEDCYGATRHGTGGKRDAGGVVDIKILKSRKGRSGIREMDILIVCSIENYPGTCRGKNRRVPELVPFVCVN